MGAERGERDPRTVACPVSARTIDAAVAFERRLERRGALPTEGHWYQADHVLGVADGGGVGTHANVLSSFQTLCAPCHEDKTARARRDRADVVDLTTLEEEEEEAEVVDLTGA